MISGEAVKVQDEKLITLMDGTATELYDERITNIGGSYIFGFDCPLEKIHLPNLRSITGKLTFRESSNVKEFIAENLVDVGTDTLFTQIRPFYYSSIEKIIVPKLGYIPGYFAEGMLNLKEVDFSNVKSISPYALMGLDESWEEYNEKLEALDLPKLEELEGDAICGFFALKKIWIPLSCTTIKAYGIWGWSGLTVYTAHQSKPDGWEEDWVNPYASIVWGATHEEFLSA